MKYYLLDWREVGEVEEEEEAQGLLGGVGLMDMTSRGQTEVKRLFTSRKPESQRLT